MKSMQIFSLFGDNDDDVVDGGGEANEVFSIEML